MTAPWCISSWMTVPAAVYALTTIADANRRGSRRRSPSRPRLRLSEVAVGGNMIEGAAVLVESHDERRVHRVRSLRARRGADGVVDVLEQLVAGTHIGVRAVVGCSVEPSSRDLAVAQLAHADACRCG
jgi:hypothetical protein